MSQVRAMRYTLERVVRGLDTIAVTGNILRDYLTDLFPIMELGTSAKMLSIVPLMAGGGMYETGAGGSAPKHVKQLVEENHLRWIRWASSSRWRRAWRTSASDRRRKAIVLAKTLDAATGKLLDNRKSPSPKTGELATEAASSISACTGRGNRGADQRPFARGALHVAGKGARGQRAEDRCRTRRGAGKGGGHRWLLQARGRQGEGRDAPKRDARSGAGRGGLKSLGPTGAERLISALLHE